MSRIGKLPIPIPDTVEVLKKEKKILVKGPRGELKVDLIDGISVNVADKEVKVNIESKNLDNGMAYWGLIRSLINNSVIGVSEGYSKSLELVGVGYRVEKQGNDLKILVGYSHPVIVKAPEGIVFEVEGNTVVKVVGIDKQLVGQVAADIRSIRKPEPYKGKGIRYSDEIVRRKQGKTAKTVA